MPEFKDYDPKTALAATDLIPISEADGTIKTATPQVITDYAFGTLDSAIAQETIEDDNLFVLRDGSETKSITGSALILSCKDSDYPSYKNLVVKNTAASPNNQIDITFDNLQIGRIHKTIGSYLAFDVETDANWDTGAASEPASGFVYVWMMAKVDGTCNPFYSLSATAPTMPSGYIYKRLFSFVKNASGNFGSFFQYNNNWAGLALAVQTSGSSTSYTNTAVALADFAPDLNLINKYHVVAYAGDKPVRLTTNGVTTDFYVHPRGSEVTFDFFMPRTGSLFQYKADSGGTTDIYIVGFELNI